MIRKARFFPVGALVAAAGGLIALRLAIEPLPGAEAQPTVDADPISSGPPLSAWMVPTDLLAAARRAAHGNNPAAAATSAHSAVSGTPTAPAMQLSGTALHRRVLAYRPSAVAQANLGLGGDLHQPAPHCQAVSYRDDPIDDSPPRRRADPNADAQDAGQHLGTTLDRLNHRSTT